MRTLFCLLAFTAVALAGCDRDTPTAPTPTPTSAISLSGNLSFGNVTVGQTATATLTIGNTGSGDLVIASVTYPTGFTGGFTAGAIAANGSQAVTITFAPVAAQVYSGTIVVTGNQASGTNTMATSGNGVAVVVPTFTLSGLVTETAPTTSTVVSGVVVTVIDGANQGRSGTTGSDGRYQITGVVNGGFSVSASKAGYRTVALPVGINGNTTFDIRLEPTAARTQFGPGQYRVGTDIPAGRYYSDSGRDCRYQRVRGFGGTTGDVIADIIVTFDAGQWIVDLLSTDAGFVTDANCGFWFTTPRQGLLTTITAGMWIVGAQLTPGTYRTENAAASCYWQRLSTFSGGADAIIANQFVSSSGPQLVTIANTDAGFSTTPECGTWTRTP